ncbi:MAG: HD domain-containing phosphohydrolase [Planctomycetota bacterium]
MSLSSTNHERPAPRAEQAWLRRVAQLRLVAAVVDADGRLAGEPVAPPAIARILGVDGVLAGIAALTPDQRWLDGRFAVSTLTRLDGQERDGSLVAIIPVARATGDGEARALAELAGLSAEDLAQAADAIPVRTDRAANDLTRMLRWTYQDLLRVSEREYAAVSLAEELSATYEELTLVQALGATPDDIRKPFDAAEQICHRLVRSGAFDWAIARFGNHEAVATELSGRIVVVGESGVPVGELRLAADLLAAELDRDAQRGEEPLNTQRESRLGLVATAPICIRGRVVGILMAQHHADPVLGYTSNELKVLAAAASSINVHLQNAALYEEQRHMFVGTLQALTASIDAKDPYTRGHSQRVADLARQLALRAGHCDEQAERVWIAGLVHDIGKIGVPEAVLRKPGRLNDDEFEAIKQHPAIGQRILADIPNFDDVLAGVLSHHERWDGRGYPSGLAGELIPHVARIIGLVDAFDAMSSVRTYRASMTRDQVLEEIQRGASAQFDPHLVGLFLEMDLSGYDEAVVNDPPMGVSSIDLSSRERQDRQAA